MLQEQHQLLLVQYELPGQDLVEYHQFRVWKSWPVLNQPAAQIRLAEALPFGDMIGAVSCPHLCAQ
jgi:hypothetical protein